MTDKEKLAWDTAGFDVPRLWVSQVHVIVNGPLVLLVLKENAEVDVQDGEDRGAVTLVRNVGSILMPAEVAYSLAEILNRHAAENAAKEKKAD